MGAIAILTLVVKGLMAVVAIVTGVSHTVTQLQTKKSIDKDILAADLKEAVLAAEEFNQGLPPDMRLSGRQLFNQVSEKFPAVAVVDLRRAVDAIANEFGIGHSNPDAAPKS